MLVENPRAPRNARKPPVLQQKRLIGAETRAGPWLHP